jgi:hypothetical protein
VSNALVAITATEARSEGERLQGQGLEIREVALGVMRKARAGFMAPDENTAFLAAVSAIVQLYPERRETLMDEARAIGDRTKMLNALMQGVPVDFERFDPAPVPDDALGLIELWRETA